MPDDYLIHLNFLPVIGKIPAFAIYRQLRSDASVPRPEGRDIHGYSLPKDSSDLEERASYWVSLSMRDAL
jgi:hypothetical protein